MLHVLSVCTILVSGAVVVFFVGRQRAIDPQITALLAGPSAVKVFADRARQRGELADGQVSPLVTQAQILAAILDPPKPPSPSVSAPPPKDCVVVQAASPPVRRERDKIAPAVELRSSSLKFSVRATSYYADRPAKSMALIAEPGGKAGSERWVREGQELGHFVVHEIRQGAVVFRQGQDLQEVAVERSQGPKDLVTAVHSPPMREIGDTNTEKQSPEGDRQDPNEDNPLEPKVVVSEGGR